MLRVLPISPVSLWRLRSLRVLNVSENRFEHFPGDVCKLVHLQDLDLRYNALTGIPSSITQLSSLAVLRLSHNRLTRFADAICEVRSLTSLDMGYNGLAELPESITLLTSLVHLDLAGNPLQVPPKEIILGAAQDDLKAIRRYFDTYCVATFTGRKWRVQLPPRLGQGSIWPVPSVLTAALPDARSVSMSMPPGVTFGQNVEFVLLEDLSSLSDADLKRTLILCGVDWTGCTEHSELVDKVRQAHASTHAIQPTHIQAVGLALDSWAPAWLSDQHCVASKSLSLRLGKVPGTSTPVADLAFFLEEHPQLRQLESLSLSLDSDATERTLPFQSIWQLASLVRLSLQPT